MKKYKAAVLILLHGAFMEIGGCLCFILVLISGSERAAVKQYFSFVPYLQENMELMLIAGLIYGMIRVIGAVGLWKNRMWGLALAVI